MIPPVVAGLRTIQQIPRGGFTGRYFHPWKPQSLAFVTFWKAEKLFKIIIYYVFFGKTCFATVLEPFVGQLHFLPSHVVLFLHLPGSRSQHAVSAVPWAPLPLPQIGHQIFVGLAILSSMNQHECWVESYLWFSSMCNRFHLCAPLSAGAREDLVNAASRYLTSAREDLVNAASRWLYNKCKKKNPVNVASR